MNDSVSCLTQSNFYSPAFNAAIFDGPIRLYFAQYQEASALRIYFRLQSELKESYLWAKNLHRSLGRHLFVMLYPSSDTFDLSFPGGSQQNICRTRLGDDDIIGVRGTISDDDFSGIYEEISDVIESWRLAPLPALQMDL